jgi:hypothetical protein
VPARADTLPDRVDVVVTMESLNTSTRSEAHLRRTPEGYRDASGKPVDVASVRALLAAMDAPPIMEPDLANLGIDAAWAARMLEPADERLDFPNATPGQIALYRKALADPRILKKAADQMFTGSASDIFPDASITLTFADGTVETVDSMSFYPLRLPWRVTRGGHDMFTFNADLARAMYAFLPEDGAGAMARDMKSAFAFTISNQWWLQGALDRAGPALARIGLHYTIDGARVGGNSVILPADEPDEDHLELELRDTAMPAGFSDFVVLSRRDGKVDGVDGFLASIGRYEMTALSPRWLVRYLKSHSDAAVQLYYLHDRSLDDANLAAFVADMRLLGKTALADEVQAEHKSIVLLGSGKAILTTWWLVLPDGRMVLWRLASGGDLLGRSDEDFQTRHCATPDALYDCSGAVISPHGVLQR